MRKMEIYFGLEGIQHKHHKYTKTCAREYIDVDIEVEKCKCNLYVVLREKKHEYVAYRQDHKREYTVDEMMHNICIQIINEWQMVGPRLVPNGSALSKSEMYQAIHSLRGPSCRTISPYINTHRRATGGTLKINLDIVDLYRLYDVYYLSNFLGEAISSSTMKKVWLALKEGGNYIPDNRQNLGILWTDNSADSLVTLCLRKLSIYNQVYGGRGNVPNVSYTMTDLHKKIFPAIEKLVKPVHSMMGYEKKLGSITFSVFNVMVKLLKVEKFKESRVFDFESALVDSLAMPLGSSSGLRAGPIRFVDHDGVKYRITPVGKKAYHLEYSEQEIRDMVYQWRKGYGMKLRDRAWCIVPKNEVLCGTTDEEVIKFMNKLRLFNIPSVVLARLQRMVHSYRQSIERGNHIAIGISFWHGGAQMFADNLHYNKKGYRWGTGDFASYDNTLKAQCLLIYSYFTDYYYCHKGDYDIFCELLKVVADNLTLKVVHLYGDIWKLMFGGMPSGAYETSHGDSWIGMFMFVHYFLNVGQVKPRIMGRVYKSMIDRELMFYIYGDDHVLAIPPYLHPAVSLESFKDFSYDIYQVELRDLFVTTSFLSVVDPKTGNLRVKNVKFLSKYFVHRSDVTTRVDLPEVLPYRETTKIIKKFAFGDGGTRMPIDYVLASIGMVYDSYGTNQSAYNFCYFMFTSMMARLGSTDFKEVLIKNHGYIMSNNLNSIFKKCGITIDELERGFPTRDELLDRHIYDKSMHTFRDESPDFGQIFV